MTGSRIRDVEDICKGQGLSVTSFGLRRGKSTASETLSEK
jgi:hypothetical protein